MDDELLNIQALTENEALKTAKNQHGDHHDYYTVGSTTIPGQDTRVYKIEKRHNTKLTRLPGPEKPPQS